MTWEESAQQAGTSIAVSYASSLLGKFGTGSRYLGRSQAREGLALARRAIAQAKIQNLLTLRGQQQELALATMPGSGLTAVNVSFVPEDRRLAHVRERVARVSQVIARHEARRARQGDSRRGGRARRQLAKLEKLETKLEVAREIAAPPPTVIPTHGINNPFVPGSRDDPSGATFPRFNFVRSY